MNPSAPLHHAVRMRLALDVMTATTPDDLGWTALHHAAAVGWVEGALAALDAGCPPAQKTVDGLTPLQLAVSSGAHALVTRLLAHNDVIRAERLEAPVAPGWNATLRAADRTDPDLLQALHAAGLLRPDAAGAVWLRTVVSRQGGALWVHRAGDFPPMERPTPEQLHWVGAGDVPTEVAHLLALHVERDAAGVPVRARSEGLELVRMDTVDTHARVMGALLPPVWSDTLTSERLQAALHDEPGALPLPAGAAGAPAQLGLARVVEALLQRGVRWWDASEPIASTLVSGRRHPEVVRVLLAALPGNAVNSVAAVAGAVLGLADRDARVLDALVARGMDPNTGVPGRGTPLLCAVRTGAVALVDRVLDHGARVNGVVAPPFTTEPTTPLREAILASDTPMVAHLLQRGADPNLPADPSSVSSTPLGSLSRISAYRQDALQPILDHLVRAGVNPHAADTLGRNALHVERHTSVVTALCQAGVRLDAADRHGWTPLQRAMLDSAPVALGFLRHATADQVHHRDAEGNTLVHLACFGGWPSREVWSALQERGLRLDGPNHAGLTPLQRALLPPPPTLGGRMGSGGTPGFPGTSPLRAVEMLLQLGADRRGLLAWATQVAARGDLADASVRALVSLLERA